MLLLGRKACVLYMLSDDYCPSLGGKCVLSFFYSQFCMRYPVSYAEMKKRIQSAMLFLGCVYIIHEFRIRFNSLYVLYSLTCLNPSSFIRVLILEQNTGHNAKNHLIRVRNLSGRGTIFSNILLNPVVGLNPLSLMETTLGKVGDFSIS